MLKLSKKVIWVPVLIFLLFWILLIKESLLGKLGGSFAKVDVPTEYIEFKDELVSDKEYSRVLWVPRLYKFTFSNTTHPAIEVQPLFGATSSSEIVRELKDPENAALLERYRIGYVVVPYDSMGTMFLTDRKYDEKLRISLEKELDSISYLQKIKDGKLAIYKTNFKSSLFSHNGNKINFIAISQDQYEIDWKDTKDGRLLFSQNYHANWRMFADGRVVSPAKTRDGLMEFETHKNYRKLKIEFIERKNYNMGWILSGFTLILLSAYLIYPAILKTKWRKK